jgi:hypothetical protein
LSTRSVSDVTALSACKSQLERLHTLSHYDTSRNFGTTCAVVKYSDS